MPRERRRGFLADVADAERINQPRQIVLFAALDLLEHVTADLAELPRDGPVGPRLARRDDGLPELIRSELIQVTEIVNETLFDQLIDERRTEPFDVHRRTGRVVLEAAAQARGTRCVLAPPDDFVLVAPERAPALRTRRRHHPRLR